MTSPYLSGSVVEGIVGLVISESQGRTNAATVSFFSEVAHHPTSLWVSIASNSLTHELIEESRQFSLIVLQRKQIAIARFCGSLSGRNEDKCAKLQLYRSPQRFWYLEGALASVACRVREIHSLDDHTLFIADILAGEIDTRRAILRHLLTTDLA